MLEILFWIIVSVIVICALDYTVAYIAYKGLTKDMIEMQKRKKINNKGDDYIDWD